MASTSPGYAVTVRVQCPSSTDATSQLTTAVTRAGGSLTALDVVESHHDAMVVDVTCDATDSDHAALITAALGEPAGFSVRKVSDRTFLIHLGGKIEVTPKVSLRTRDDLSRAYTPGVARVCLAIAENPPDARRLTVKRNSVAVVTDGSAVLGLGNIGPSAALPVMEGKAALFKRFAGIDAWPICLDTQDADAIVEIVRALSPGFGGINLEDISAPRCFQIEARLREILDIPVFHDDQHGTAIVVLAALRNALRVVGKQLSDVRIVMSGAGAAGQAILHVLIGVSAPDILTGDDVASMAEGSIVFALANPVPEIDPGIARQHAAVVATGRSDYPNQINNVLAFPGVFRGLLDASATGIGTDMLIAAAKAISDSVSPEERNANYIIPSVFHADVHSSVAAAVRAAAR